MTDDLNEIDDRLTTLQRHYEEVVENLKNLCAYTIGPDLDPKMIDTIDAPDLRSLLRSCLASIDNVNKDMVRETTISAEEDETFLWMAGPYEAVLLDAYTAGPVPHLWDLIPYLNEEDIVICKNLNNDLISKWVWNGKTLKPQENMGNE